MRPRSILGALFCILGAVWIGQGVGLIGGSFMTGQALWAIIGAAAVVFGVTLMRPRRTPK